MSDVFVSYARQDEPHAKRVVEALRSLGYDVWRDDELPVHRPYSEVIEERLTSAKAVLVLWSAAAIGSQWVRAEAEAGRARGALIQCTLDGELPPLPFNQIQCAELEGWDGRKDVPGWTKLAESVAALVGSKPQKQRPLRRVRTSICVLPFQNMSGDPEQEYFSDGISEDITTDLSKISALEVIARNTAFTLKGQAVDVCEVAEKFNVTHVLEGSVRKVGGRVRVTAQLIDGSSGGHVWGERYDRDLTDIFAIQDEISKAIVDALKVRLLPEEERAIGNHGTTNSSAYNLYLMARQCWIIGDFGDQRREKKVIRICKRAVEIDPNYPQAWALMGLAQANLRHGFSGYEDLDDGSAAADRALKLDPQIAEAHLPKAWQLAEKGRHDEANAEIATALRLAPDSWEVNKEAARLFYRQRRLEDAARHLEKATQVMETDFHGLGMLFAYYHSKGDQDAARGIARRTVEQVEKALARDADNGAALAFGAMSLASLGNQDRAREWIERCLLVDPDNLQMRYNLAWGFNKILGEPEEAINMLEGVLADAGANIIRLAANDPNLDNLRDDPRFQMMLDAAEARVGLAAAVKPAAAT
jgi:adenylate cyclase